MNEEELKKEIEEIQLSCGGELISEYDLERLLTLKGELKGFKQGYTLATEDVLKKIDELFKKWENPSYDCYKEASILDYTINEIKKELKASLKNSQEKKDEE